MKKKRINSRKFKRFLYIYSGVLAGIIIITLILLHGLLKDYEEGRPAFAMDKIVKQFTADQVDNLVDSASVEYNDFENNDVVSNYLRNKIDNETITYKKKSGEYSEETPVYVVYAGDTALAKVNLIENGKNAHKFTKWKLGALSFSSNADGQNKISISVPKGSVLKLNGIEVNDNYITGNDVEFAPCKNVGSYVKKPVRTVYTVENLLVKPDISVELNGKQLTVDAKKNEYTAQYPEDEELLNAQKAHIMEIAETYGKYIINRSSLNNLSNYMIGKAKDYVSDVPAIWAFLYGKTYTYEFQNESIEHVVKYSNDCFSCDIHYDLYVDWSSGNKTYDTSLTYTFVKKNGTWYVADFVLN